MNFFIVHLNKSTQAADLQCKIDPGTSRASPGSSISSTFSERADGLIEPIQHLSLSPSPLLMRLCSSFPHITSIQNAIPTDMQKICTSIPYNVPLSKNWKLAHSTLPCSLWLSKTTAPNLLSNKCNLFLPASHSGCRQL